MKNLVNMNANQEQTMTSLDLREMVNEARNDAGEKPIRNADFLAKVIDELDISDETYGFPVGYKMNSQGTKSAYYELTLEQCMLVGMRESKAVRRSVLAKLKELEAKQYQLPDFTNPVEAARAWADSEEGRLIAIATVKEQEASLAIAAPKVNHYDTVVERTNLVNATQVGGKFKMSARKLNEHLDYFDVYNKNVTRSRVFKKWFIDEGYGEVKQTMDGYTQSLFTMKGEAWVIEQLTSEGII